MSEGKDDGAGRRAPNGRQWRKGQSGNPKGRPKKKVEPSSLEMNEMILTEGLKPITVTEGGKPVTLPAVAAVFRANLVAAMKGNSHAQRSFLNLVANAQAHEQKRKADAIEAGLRLKIQLDFMIKEAVARGQSELDLPTHPSDIEINFETGEVKCFVAFTDEQCRLRSRFVSLRDYLLTRIERSLAAAAEDGDDELLRLGREMNQRLISRLNELLPPRMRRLPPGEKPEFDLDRPPEELWQALMRPQMDVLLARLSPDLPL